jgi:HlyD family secretion protein
MSGVRRVPVALSLASVVLLALTAVSCGDDNDGIVVAEVDRADVVETVDAPATVVSTAVATLTAAADGTLAELTVAPGDEVTAGDILAVVDSPTAQRTLERAGEALAAASQGMVGQVGTSGELIATQRATDEAAGVAFAQARDAAGQIAEEELRQVLLAQVDAAEAQYAAAALAAQQAARSVQEGVASLGAAVTALGSAQRLQAEQAFDLAQATVDALTLRAPFDGVVQLGGVAAPPAGGLPDLFGAAGGLPGGLSGGLSGGLPGAAGDSGAGPGVDRAVTVGAPVRAGTPVVTVVDVSGLALRAEVDETDVLLVTPDVPADVELDAAIGATYRAVVTVVDVLPTPTARGGVAYGVRLTLEGGTFPDGSAAPEPKPGMSAIVRLRVREATDVVAVPVAAVLRVDDADTVWVVRDGRAVRTLVTVGAQGLDLVEIRSGLRAGDRVVVRGADLVVEGQQVS